MLLMLSNPSLRTLYTPSLFGAVAAWHAAEALLVPLDRGHQAHHWVTVALGVSGACTQGSDRFWQAGLTCLLPLVTNVFSVWRFHGPPIASTVYYHAYVAVKLVCVATLWRVHNQMFPSEQAQLVLPVCMAAALHAVQLYFVAKIVRKRLGTFSTALHVVLAVVLSGRLAAGVGH